MQPVQRNWPKNGLKNGSSASPASPMKVVVPAYTSSLAPSNLARSPMLWTTHEVKAWLEFCVEEFSLNPLCMDKFHMNGKALCLLLRNDFMERAPHAGDVLFNAFQQLKAQDSNSPGYSNLPLYGANTSNRPMTIVSPTCQISPLPVSDSVTKIPSFTFGQSHPCFVPILPQPSTGVNGSAERNTPFSTNSRQLGNNDFREDLSSVPDSLLSPAPTEKYSSDSDSCHNDSGQSPLSVDQSQSTENTTATDNDLHLGLNLSASEGESRLLWEFIYQLLQDEKYADLVCWDKEAERQLRFRINKPMELADLWGKQKNRSNMTYEKLSRALRYYYKMNIIHKVQGKKLTYEFLQHPAKIRKGQRGARPHSQKMMSNSAHSERPESESEALLVSCTASPVQSSPETAIFQKGLVPYPDKIQSHLMEESRRDKENGIQINIDNIECGTHPTLPPHNYQMEKFLSENEQEQLPTHKGFGGIKSCDPLYQPSISCARDNVPAETKTGQNNWMRDRSPNHSLNVPSVLPSAETPPMLYHSTLSTPKPPKCRNTMYPVKSPVPSISKFNKYPTNSITTQPSTSESLDVYKNDGSIHKSQCVAPSISHGPALMYKFSSHLQTSSDATSDRNRRRVPETMEYHELKRSYYFPNSLSSDVKQNRKLFEEQDKPEDLSVKKGPCKTEKPV